MNPRNTASKDQELRPGDLDVLLARMAGMVAASIGRLDVHGDAGPAVLGMTEIVAWHLIEALSGVVPEYRGLSPVEIAQRDGAVGIVSKLTKMPPAVIAKQIVGTFLSLRLSILALEHGAVFVPRTRAPGLLDALFQPIHRRAARRYLERFTATTDMGTMTVDFAAAWQVGTPPIRHQRIAPDNFATLSGRQATVITALIGFLMAADAWTVRANPVDVFYLALINGGAERWKAGSEAFRRAITEALFVATRPDIELEELRNDPTAWDRVLGDETAEWASSVLLAFMQLTGRPKEARFSLLQFLKELERDARKSEGGELIDEHLRRLRRGVVNLDDEHSKPVGREDEHIASIPAVEDIRTHLRRTPMTRRERQVLNLKAQDYDYQTIGNHLGITASTARVLMQRVRRAAGHKRLASPRRVVSSHRKRNGK